MQQVLHVHWQPATSPDEAGGMLFWCETAVYEQPAKIDRRSKQPKPHPYLAKPAAVTKALHRLTGITVRKSEVKTAVLWLPTGQAGPHTSPQLFNPFQADDKLVWRPWEVTGVWVSVEQGYNLLQRLPNERPQEVRLGASCRYWQTAVSLVLEIIAQQKVQPSVVQHGDRYEARWRPVLDGEQDGPRLARLAAAMPPLCRAETTEPESALAPKHLLQSFLNTLTDTLIRWWAAGNQPAAILGKTDSGARWLQAHFAVSPRIKGSKAQLAHLYQGYQAWLRSLTLAGDDTFRLALRLETPLQKENGQPNDDWQLHFLLQAREDPSLLVPATQVWQSRNSILTQLGKQFVDPQEKLLAGLGYAARFFAPLQRGLQTARPIGVALTTQEAYQFLREAAPLLEQSGFGLLVPPWWNKPGTRLGVRLRMSGKNTEGRGKTAVSRSLLTFDNLVSYSWELSLGETTLTREEFDALVALKSPLVQIRGQWVQLSAEQIEAAIRFWEKQRLEATVSLTEAVQMGLSHQEEVEGLQVDGVDTDGWLNDWMKQLKQEERLKTLSPPANLNATLRPYQQYGYSWIDFMHRWGMGAILADDMGLGKTITTLSMIQNDKDQAGKLPKPILLICPTSVVTNWEREAQKFTPNLATLVHQGGNRLRESALIEAALQTDMVLTSYALVRRDADTLQTIDWYGVVLDEAQNIKNPNTKQARAIRALSANFKLALTGTPVENRLSELWSIMQFLNPGYLGSQQGFRKKFVLPIERYGDETAVSQLRQLTTPFILRRVKTDPTVIQDLPDKQETKVFCHLTEEQATLYEAVVQETMLKVAESDGIQRRGLVLGMLTKLKQICNHPAQFLHQVGDSSVDKTADLFSQTRSGKLQRLAQLLEEALASDERALIFTQFAEMGHLLESFLQNELGLATQFLHGGVPAKRRRKMIDRFQEDPDGPPIFLLSLKAGGTGLNLTRANHVFHFDRWWNPAVENQATDRAFRIGQQKNVLVHKFVCIGTLEERIDEMIESKKALAESVVGSGENWLTEISTADLRDLVRLRREEMG